jgi:hypothetical protein
VSHLERVGTMMEMSCLFTLMFVCFVHGKAFIAVGIVNCCFMLMLPCLLSHNRGYATGDRAKSMPCCCKLLEGKSARIVYSIITLLLLSPVIFERCTERQIGSLLT